MSDNDNCLEGIRCTCGNDQVFRVEVTVVCTVTDDGAEPSGDMEWTDESWCFCPHCDREGKLSEFREEEIDQ